MNGTVFEPPLHETKIRTSVPLVADIQNFAQDVFDTVREPLLVLDAGLRVRSANSAFYQTFHVSAAETENQLIYELGNGQWDIAALRTLLEDIVPFVESSYRAATTADKRAIVGLSMGGGQSLTTGLSHLDTFDWIGGFSSAPPEGDLEKTFPNLTADAAKKLGLLWVGVGKKDFLLERNEKFNAWLTDHQIKHTWVLSEGGHEWPVWRKYLAEFLPLIFR